MIDNISIEGILEVTLEDKNGNIKDHILKKNTITQAAVGSMFCDFLFGGLTYDSREFSYISTIPQERPELSFIRPKTMGGYDTRNSQMPIYSFSTPDCLAAYVVNKPVKITTLTGSPPYVNHTLINQHDSISFAYFGRTLNNNEVTPKVLESMNDIDVNKRMTYDHIKTWFNPTTFEYSLEFYAVSGEGTARSIIFGSGHKDLSVFEVRTRPEGNPFAINAGQSQFWCVEHRPNYNVTIGEDGVTEIKTIKNVETILWQDTTLRFVSENSGVVPLHSIPGYNLTKGETEFTRKQTTNHLFMGGFMQGIIIGENAFGVEKTSNNEFKLTKYRYWNTDVPPDLPPEEVLQPTSTIYFRYRLPNLNEFPGNVNNAPILVHNIETGNIELIATTAYNGTNFLIGKAVINPDDIMDYTAFYYLSASSDYSEAFALGNLALSRKGTSDSILDSAQDTGTSALASTGFLDYRNGNYYLPQSALLKNGEVFGVGSIVVNNNDTLRMQCSRIGLVVQFFDVPLSDIGNQVGIEICNDLGIFEGNFGNLTGEEVLKTNFPDAEAGDFVRVNITGTIWVFNGDEWVDSLMLGVGSIQLLDNYLINYPISGTRANSMRPNVDSETAQNQTYNTRSINKYLEWCYYKDDIIQFLPITGVAPGSTRNIHPFTYFHASRIFCGTDFGRDTYKSIEDVLRVRYSWRPTIQNPLTPMLTVNDTPNVRGCSVVITVFNPYPKTLRSVSGTLLMEIDPDEGGKIIFPIQNPNGNFDCTFLDKNTTYPEIKFTIPMMKPYQRETISIGILFNSVGKYTGLVILHPDSDNSYHTLMDSFENITLSES